MVAMRRAGTTNDVIDVDEDTALQVDMRGSDSDGSSGRKENEEEEK